MSLGKKTAPDHFFYFDVPNAGETQLKAVAGEFSDESVIRKVQEFNEEYRLKEKNAIINWFEVNMPDGYFSINDKLSDIMSTLRGKIWVGLFLMKIMPKKDSKAMGGFTMTEELKKMLGSFTILRLTGMIGMVGATVTKEQLLDLNKKLNRIRKPKAKKK